MRPASWETEVFQVVRPFSLGSKRLQKHQGGEDRLGPNGEERKMFKGGPIRATADDTTHDLKMMKVPLR